MVPLKTRLAQAIRAARRARRISQEQLAAAAGIHRTYMSRIERGQANITLAVAERLAAALRIRLSELLRQAESPTLGDRD